MTERKWAMRRVKAGDYLLRSNDRATLWRIAQYDEDGSLMTHDGKQVRGKFWMVYRYTRPLPKTDAERLRFAEHVEAWDYFEGEYALCKSRAAAVEWAMRQDEARVAAERMKDIVGETINTVPGRTPMTTAEWLRTQTKTAHGRQAVSQGRNTPSEDDATGE